MVWIENVSKADMFGWIQSIDEIVNSSNWYEPDDYIHILFNLFLLKSGPYENHFELHFRLLVDWFEFWLFSNEFDSNRRPDHIVP